MKTTTFITTLLLTGSALSATISKIGWTHFDAGTATNSAFQVKSSDGAGGYDDLYYVALNDTDTASTYTTTNTTHVQGSTTGFPSNTNLGARSSGWHSYELDFSTAGAVDFSMDGGTAVTTNLVNLNDPITFSMAFRDIYSTGGIDRYMAIGEVTLTLSDGQVLNYPFNNASELNAPEWSVFRQDPDTYYDVNAGVLRIGNNRTVDGTRIAELMIDVTDICTVPEPSGIALISLAGLSLFRARKR